MIFGKKFWKKILSKRGRQDRGVFMWGKKFWKNFYRFCMCNSNRVRASTMPISRLRFLALKLHLTTTWHDPCITTTPCKTHTNDPSWYAPQWSPLARPMPSDHRAVTKFTNVSIWYVQPLVTQLCHQSYIESYWIESYSFWSLFSCVNIAQSLIP